MFPSTPPLGPTTGVAIAAAGGGVGVATANPSSRRLPPPLQPNSSYLPPQFDPPYGGVGYDPNAFAAPPPVVAVATTGAPTTAVHPVAHHPSHESGNSSTVPTAADIQRQLLQLQPPSPYQQLSPPLATSSVVGPYPLPLALSSASPTVLASTGKEI